MLKSVQNSSAVFEVVERSAMELFHLPFPTTRTQQRAKPPGQILVRKRSLKPATIAAVVQCADLLRAQLWSRLVQIVDNRITFEPCADRRSSAPTCIILPSQYCISKPCRHIDRFQVVMSTVTLVIFGGLLWIKKCTH